MCKIDVLDHGYVRLVDIMGSDLSPVNAARASFAKESRELSEKDISLINYLVDNSHMSPFRHAFISFEVKAPLMIARQWWKYIVGSDHSMDGWNEQSRRYVSAEPEFYIPDTWRKASEDKKQGSGENVDSIDNRILTMDYTKYLNECASYYRDLIKKGIAPEQARLVLPAYAMYTTWYWSTSLQGVLHFIEQRLGDDAQDEIQQYAKAIANFVKTEFPYSYLAYLGEDDEHE